jgi:hypothetical protein
VKKSPAWIMNWKKNMVNPPTSRALASRSMSTSGSRPRVIMRRSQAKNTRITTRPARMNQTVGEMPSQEGASALGRTHPHSPDRSTPYTARPRPEAESSVPT